MVRGWFQEGARMVCCGKAIVTQLEKTEKITINIGLVDLGQIDLLVN
jgi:hypothetical protein